MASNKYKVIYKELPIKDISFLRRESFSPTGNEKDFYRSLKKSISKHGLKDPVSIEYGGDRYGDKFKIIIGNNRMVIAEELGINKIPALIVNYKPDTFNIEGKVLNTDEEIRSYFYLPDKVQVRRNKEGIIDQIMPHYYMEVKHLYV